MKVTPKRTFLVGQKVLEGGKRQDIIAHRGVPVDLSDEQVIKFWGALNLTDEQKKKYLAIAKRQKYLRTV